MFEQLLNEITSKGIIDTIGLAHRLGTTPQMVKTMLEHLERSGILEKIGMCEEVCQGCGLAAQCMGGEKKNDLWEYRIIVKP